MLSICIPVYNQNVVRLAETLHHQTEGLKKKVEILIYDDASSPLFEQQNQGLSSLSLVHYKALKNNLGRSRIRNLLAREARFDYLLFMDGDSQVPDKHFLKRYVAASKGSHVICGGRSYGNTPTDPTFYLHWLYGKKREESKAADRQKNPRQAFMSNNFMIRRDLLLRWPFDEDIAGYGHEDTLFGYTLLKNGIRIDHIDNPLMHEGLETNTVFLEKTRQACRNLVMISRKLSGDPVFVDMVRLLKSHARLKRTGTLKLYRAWFIRAEPRLLKKLSGPSPSLRSLDLCKLGWVCRFAGQNP